MGVDIFFKICQVESLESGNFFVKVQDCDLQKGCD